VAEVEKLAGYRPSTEYDVRRLLERKDIDAVSIAAPDYWHALMTVWACQAGKDVYVEKPVSFTITEGRRMVEAARKYKRIVQAGLNMRSEPVARAATRLLHDGKLGTVYRAKVTITKARSSIGRVKEASVPEGVHWDLYLGPTPFQPFTTNHFHYGWHFFWQTSTSDVGNTGVHHLDLARWGMNQSVHPVKVHSTGGNFVWDSEQETPNYQVATLEYADGRIMDVELTNLYAPPAPAFNVFYTTEGYLSAGDERQLSENHVYAGEDRPGGGACGEPLRELHRVRALAQGGGLVLRHPAGAPIDDAVPPGEHLFPHGAETDLRPGHGAVREGRGSEPVPDAGVPEAVCAAGQGVIMDLANADGPR
jgi:predicted dehydrogenase